MSMRPIIQTQSRGIHSIGLSTSTIRSFTSTPTSLLSRRIPHPAFRPSRVHTATVPLRRHPLLFTLTAASALSLPYFTTRSTVLHDSSPDFSTSAYSHGRDAKVPLSKDGGRSINPRAIRQISMGSILGLGLGVLVSAFSKMLVLLVGVGIVISQVSCVTAAYGCLRVMLMRDPD